MDLVLKPVPKIKLQFDNNTIRDMECRTIKKHKNVLPVLTVYKKSLA